MATFTKLPSGNWRAQVRLVGQKPIGKTFSKKDDARTWTRVMEGDEDAIDAFPDAEARRRTLANAIDPYMLQYDGRDVGLVSRLAWWKLHYGHQPLAKFNHPSQIKDGLRKLATEPAHRGNGKGKNAALDRKKGKATINRHHAAVSSVLTWATEEGWITRNAAKGIVRRKEPKGRVRYLDDAERAALLAACDASEWSELGLLVRLALSTGARLGELLGLRWEHIDLKAGLARVGKTKNDDPRSLPLVASVKTRLEAMARPIKGGLLFPSPRKSEQPFEFRKDWNAAVTAAKLKDFKFHDLRHSAASYMAMAGLSPLEIGDMLGHRTLVMVKRYSHLSTEHKQKLAERVLGGKV